MWCSTSVQKTLGAVITLWNSLGSSAAWFWIFEYKPRRSHGAHQAKDIRTASKIKPLTNISYGESLLSQDSSTEEFMALDLPLKSMKSLANANQALYTHSPMLSRWHSQQNTLRSLEGGAVEGLSGRRQCNLCGLEVILFMSKWACLFLSIVK